MCHHHAIKKVCRRGLETVTPLPRWGSSSVTLYRRDHVYTSEGYRFPVFPLVLLFGLLTLTALGTSTYSAYRNDGLVICLLLVAAPFLGVRSGKHLFIMSLEPPAFLNPFDMLPIDLFMGGWISVPVVGFLAYILGRWLHYSNSDAN